MPTRRKFIKQASAALSLSTLPEIVLSNELIAQINRAKKLPIKTIAEDEEFWRTIKQEYTASTTLVNLNNGGVSPSPKVVQDALDRYNRMCNEAPSYYMWQILDKGA